VVASEPFFAIAAADGLIASQQLTAIKANVPSARLLCGRLRAISGSGR